MEQCKHESTINRLVRIIDGNGKRGILQDVIVIDERVTKMEESIDKLATAYSALARNDSNREAVRKALGKGLITASVIVGMFGTIITLIIKIL